MESKIEFFAKNFCFVKASFGSEKGRILGFSSNAGEILGYEANELTKNINTINDLVPAPMDKFHNSSVSLFLENGISNAFR